MNSGWLLRIACATLVVACSTAPRTPEEHARAFLDRYIALGDADDPRAIDLYADGGRIEKYLITRDGRRLSFSAISLAEWKARMRQRFDTSVAQGIRAKYSDATFTRDGDFVWIRVKRTLTPPGVTLAQELLVGPGPDSVWQIWSEVSQVHSTRQ